ncbi:MAG: glycosyltransferase family 4 protein, partial [Bacteroidota bacterium]
MENYSEFAVNYIKKKSFDIIHAHDWLTIGTGLNLKNILKKPLVMHIHSLETDRNGEESRGHIYELEKQGMKSADLIIAVSHYTKNKIIDHYKINPEKIEVAHNGNNFRKTSFTKTKKSTVTVGFIGRLTQQKGPDIFLKIAEKVLDKNKNIQFIVTGVGEKLEKLIKQTSENYMGDKIHFTGFINPTTMKKLMKKIDLYCMPSVSEPFGLTAVEAASCNIPCLISKQSGVKEVLKNSITFDFWDINKAAGII